MPFGQWQCSKCHSPLRFRVLPFFLSSLAACTIALVYALPFHLLGFGDTPWALSGFLVFGIAMHWLTVRLATVDAVL